jgi:putative ABC transport system permease protein
MGVFIRGIKNAFRNGVRTIAVIFILAVSISMALIMFMALKTVNDKIASVKSSIGNTITVSPAGIRGFEGGGTLLSAQNATDVTNLAHVTSVTQTLSDRLGNGSSSSNPGGESSSTNSTTNLTSPINPGSFGNRTRNFQGGSSSSSNATFTMPIQVTGTNSLSTAALSVNQITLTSGSNIDPSSSDNVAMVGKDLASKNNLSVGSTFTAYSQTIKVVGIYDTGNTFTNASVVMPIKTVQNLSNQAGQIDSLIVTADSIDNVSSVQTAIKNKLGSAVDVTSQQDRSNEAITPLQNIKSISLYSLIGSLVAGAVIILLIMVMVVRERRREIGVLKAIGSSNAKIVEQFIIEALVLTLLSSVIGIILGFIFSNPVLKVLVNNSTTSATSSGGPGGGAGRAISRIGGFFGGPNALQNLHAVLNYQVILYGLGAAIVIAIIGSAIPAFLIAKIRPAEVMRAE